MKKILLAFFLSLLFTGAFSQDKMVFTGKVTDTSGVQPLNGAIVMAIRISDNQLLGFTRSNPDGTFKLTNVPVDTMRLLVCHYKFDQKVYYIFGSKDNKEIHIPNVSLPQKAVKLDEVVVYANKKPIYYRGDTLVYTADSFATKKYANVEDLLKNLPGITVDDNGNVSSQGEQISKVLVDGDEFFGTDPTIATKNLQAKGVDKVQVYETENENSGGNSEDKVKVMNIQLKDEYKDGYFGKVAGSGGFNTEYFRDQPNGKLFYNGEVLFNYFNDDLKVSVFGKGTNTPNVGFSYQDASKFGLTNEMGGRFQSFLNPNVLKGIPENYKGGFYFSNKFGKKNQLEMNLNYTYNDSRLLQNQVRESQYHFSDSSYIKMDTLQKYQAKKSHTINFNLDYKINDKTELSLKSNLTLHNEKMNSDNNTNYFTVDSARFSGNRVSNNQSAEGLEGNVTLKLEKKFEKRFRELDVEYQLGYTKNDEGIGTQSDLQFLIGNMEMDTSYNQQRNINNSTTGHRLLIDYTEPLSRKFRLKFQYRLDYFYGNQSTKTNTFNPTTDSYDQFNPLFSNDFSNTRLSNRGSAGIYFVTRKQSLDVGARVRNVVIDNLNNVTGEIIHQDVTDVLPYLLYTYEFSNAKRLRFRYRTSSSQPSLNQLQPVRDNTNPNYISEGNPDLKPNYTHSLRLSYHSFNALKRSFVFAGTYFNYTNNAFSNAIQYLSDGRVKSKTINVDNNINGGLYAGTGIPTFDGILRIRPMVFGNYWKQNSLINTQLNTTQNYSVNGSLSLEVRSDTMEVSLEAKVGYNYPISSLSMGINEPYLTQMYKAEIFFELPWRFFINSDITYTINSRRAEGFNEKPLIWNAKLSRRFLKTGNLIVHVDVYDIFNQNVGISRSVSTNVITDQRSQIIARYFMLGATWQFNNNKTKVEDDKRRFF